MRPALLACLLLAACSNPEPVPVGQVETPKCDVGMVAVKLTRAEFVNDCRTRDCTVVKGAATLTNNCPHPVGVKLKATAVGPDGSPLAVNEFWPASTRNLPTGESSISLDQAVEAVPAAKSLRVEVVEVREW